MLHPSILFGLCVDRQSLNLFEVLSSCSACASICTRSIRQVFCLFFLAQVVIILQLQVPFSLLRFLQLSFWKVIWSRQGSRMGCVGGSFGFDLTVDDIYKATARKFPNTVIKALTDDLTCGIPPPRSKEDAKNCWKMAAELLEFISTESEKVAGLPLNFSKCHALAPKSIPNPPPKTLPNGTNIEREGLRLAGCPIGTDEFCKNYMQKIVREVQLKMDALQGIDPQIGIALLRIGIIPGLMLSSQVTPPKLTMESLIQHDTNIINTVFKLLNPPDKASPHPAPSQE